MHRDLRPIVLFARFDLLEFGDDRVPRRGDMARNRLALRFQAQPRGALLRGRDSEEATSLGTPGALRRRSGCSTSTMPRVSTKSTPRWPLWGAAWW